MYQCPCVVHTRPGTFFLSFEHVCFRSNLLGFATSKVVPIPTIKRVAKQEAALGLAPAIMLDLARSNPKDVAAGKGNVEGEVTFHFPVDRDQIFELLDQVVAMNQGRTLEHGTDANVPLSIAGAGAAATKPTSASALVLQPQQPHVEDNEQGQEQPAGQRKMEVTFSDEELVDDPPPTSTFGFASRLVGSLWGSKRQEQQEERGQEQEPIAAAPLRPPVAVADLLDIDVDDTAREDEL